MRLGSPRALHVLRVLFPRIPPRNRLFFPRKPRQPPVVVPDGESRATSHARRAKNGGGRNGDSLDEEDPESPPRHPPSLPARVLFIPPTQLGLLRTFPNPPRNRLPLRPQAFSRSRIKNSRRLSVVSALSRRKMASAAAGRIGGSPSAGVLRRNGRKAGGCGRVTCASTSPPRSSSSGLADQYKTLRIQPGASEFEVKRAFRQLALQHHPDVCKGSNCEVQFHRITEAYNIVMADLRASEEEEDEDRFTAAGDWGRDDDQMRGMCDPNWDLWEEWMGFEGASITGDYSSHINPYI